MSHACFGPVLRGSGIRWDLRRDDPYELDIPVGPSGDVWDWSWVRRDLRKSLRPAANAPRLSRCGLCGGFGLDRYRFIGEVDR